MWKNRSFYILRDKLVVPGPHEDQDSGSFQWQKHLRSIFRKGCRWRVVGSPWITSVGQVKGNWQWKATQIVALRRKGEQDSLSAGNWTTPVAPKSHVKYGKHLSFTSRRGMWKRYTEDFCKDRRVVALRVLVYHVQVRSHFLISVVLSAR